MKDTTIPSAAQDQPADVDAIVKRGMQDAAPPYIYIQECGDCDDDCHECTHSFSDGEEVTWCMDKINDSDIEYICLDIVIEMLRETIRQPKGVVPDSVAELFKQNRLSF